MAAVIDRRMSAEMDGEFVVFLIGMRINRIWKIHKWLPVLLAMPRMIKELEAHPQSGFMGHTGMGKVMVQYWRTFEQLEYYARHTTKSTGRPGSSLTSGLAGRAAMWGSGTRPT